MESSEKVIRDGLKLKIQSSESWEKYELDEAFVLIPNANLEV